MRTGTSIIHGTHQVTVQRSADLAELNPAVAVAVAGGVVQRRVDLAGVLKSELVK